MITRRQERRSVARELGGIMPIILSTIIAMLLVLSCPDRGICHVTDANMPDAVAEMEYQMLLEFQPQRLDIRNKLGMVLLRKKKFKEAEHEFLTILEAEPANFNAIDGLGLVMSQTGRRQKAVEQFLKAIAVNPQDVMVHYHLGLAYAASGDKDSAEKAYRQALELAEQPLAEPLPESNIVDIRNALAAISTPHSTKP